MTVCCAFCREPIKPDGDGWTHANDYYYCLWFHAWATPTWPEGGTAHPTVSFDEVLDHFGLTRNDLAGAESGCGVERCTAVHACLNCGERIVHGAVNGWTHIGRGWLCRYPADTLATPEAHLAAAAPMSAALEAVTAERDESTENSALRSRVAAVEALHVDHDGWCWSCQDSMGSLLWPCPTIRALTATDGAPE